MRRQPRQRMRAAFACRPAKRRRARPLVETGPAGARGPPGGTPAGAGCSPAKDGRLSKGRACGGAIPGRATHDARCAPCAAGPRGAAQACPAGAASGARRYGFAGDATAPRKPGVLVLTVPALRRVACANPHAQRRGGDVTGPPTTTTRAAAVGSRAVDNYGAPARLGGSVAKGLRSMPASERAGDVRGKRLQTAPGARQRRAVPIPPPGAHKSRSGAAGGLRADANIKYKTTDLERHALCIGKGAFRPPPGRRRGRRGRRWAAAFGAGGGLRAA